MDSFQPMDSRPSMQSSSSGRQRGCELAVKDGALFLFFFFPVHNTNTHSLWLSNFPLVPWTISPADVPVDICTKWTVPRVIHSYIFIAAKDWEQFCEWKIDSVNDDTWLSWLDVERKEGSHCVHAQADSRIYCWNQSKLQKHTIICLSRVGKGKIDICPNC